MKFETEKLKKLIPRVTLALALGLVASACDKDGDGYSVANANAGQPAAPAAPGTTASALNNAAPTTETAPATTVKLTLPTPPAVHCTESGPKPMMVTAAPGHPEIMLGGHFICGPTVVKNNADQYIDASGLYIVSETHPDPSKPGQTKQEFIGQAWCENGELTSRVYPNDINFQFPANMVTRAVGACASNNLTIETATDFNALYSNWPAGFVFGQPRA